MPTPFNVDIEAGSIFEERICGATLDDGVYGVGSFVTERQSGPLPGKSKSVDNAATGPGLSDTPRKAYDFYPTHARERRATAILESWDSSAESILFFAGLLSMAVSLFIIEGYERSSPDAADQASASFDQLSHLVGVLAEKPFGLLLPPHLALGATAPFTRSTTSAVRATILWRLSLSMNMTCVLWVLWLRWWLQSIDPLARGEPHAHARLLPYPFSRIGRFGLGRMVEVIWMLLQSSALLFLVGLVDLIHPINATIAWILLGYLALLACLHAARALLPYRFLRPHRPTISLDSA